MQFSTGVGRRESQKRLLVARSSWDTSVDESEHGDDSSSISRIGLQVGPIATDTASTEDSSVPPVKAQQSGSVRLKMPSAVLSEPRELFRSGRRPVRALDDESAYELGRTVRPRSTAGTRPSVLHKPRLSTMVPYTNHHSPGEATRVIRDGDGGLVAVTSPFKRPLSRLQAAARVPASPVLVAAAMEATVRNSRRRMARSQRPVSDGTTRDRGSAPSPPPTPATSGDTGRTTDRNSRPPAAPRRQHSAQPGFDGIVAVLAAVESTEARARHAADSRASGGALGQAVGQAVGQAHSAESAGTQLSVYSPGDTVGLGSYHPPPSRSRQGTRGGENRSLERYDPVPAPDAGRSLARADHSAATGRDASRKYDASFPVASGDEEALGFRGTSARGRDEVIVVAAEGASNHGQRAGPNEPTPSRRQEFEHSQLAQAYFVELPQQGHASVGGSGLVDDAGAGLGLMALSTGGESGIELQDIMPMNGEPERASVKAGGRDFREMAQPKTPDATRGAAIPTFGSGAAPLRTSHSRATSRGGGTAASKVRPSSKSSVRFVQRPLAGFSSAVDAEVATEPKYRRPMSRAVSSQSSRVETDPLVYRKRMRIYSKGTDDSGSEDPGAHTHSASFEEMDSGGAGDLIASGSIPVLDSVHVQQQAAMDAAIKARRRASASHRKRFLLSSSRGRRSRYQHRRSVSGASPGGFRASHQEGSWSHDSSSYFKLGETQQSRDVYWDDTRLLHEDSADPDTSGFIDLVERGSSRAQDRVGGRRIAGLSSSMDSIHGVHDTPVGRPKSATAWYRYPHGSNSDGEFSAFVLSENGSSHGAAAPYAELLPRSPLRPRPSTSYVLYSASSLDSSMAEEREVAGALSAMDDRKAELCVAPEVPDLVLGGTKLPAVLSIFRTDVLAADLAGLTNTGKTNETLEPIFRDPVTHQWRQKIWPVALRPTHALLAADDGGSSGEPYTRPYRSMRRDFACVHVLAATLQQHLRMDHALRQLASVARELLLHREAVEASDLGVSFALAGAGPRGLATSRPGRGPKKARRSSLATSRPGSRGLRGSIGPRGAPGGTTTRPGRRLSKLSSDGSQHSLHTGRRGSGKARRFSFGAGQDQHAQRQMAILSEPAKTLAEAGTAVGHVLLFLLLWSGHIRPHEYENWLAWVRRTKSQDADGSGAEGGNGSDSPDKRHRHHHRHQRGRQHHGRSHRHRRRSKISSRARRPSGSQSAVSEGLAKLLRLGAAARFQRAAGAVMAGGEAIEAVVAGSRFSSLLKDAEADWTVSYSSEAEPTDALYEYDVGIMEQQGPPVGAVGMAGARLGFDLLRWYVPFAYGVLQASQTTAARSRGSRPSKSRATDGVEGKADHHHRYRAGLLALLVAAKVRQGMSVLPVGSLKSAFASGGIENERASKIGASSVAASDSDDDFDTKLREIGNAGETESKGPGSKDGRGSQATGGPGDDASVISRLETQRNRSSLLHQCLQRQSDEVQYRAQAILEMCFQEAMRLVYADEWTANTVAAQKYSTALRLEMRGPGSQSMASTAGLLMLRRSSDPSIPHALVVAPLLLRVWRDRYVVGAKLLREAEQEAKVYDEILKQTNVVSRAARHELKRAQRQGKKLNRIARELRRQLIALSYIVFPWGREHEYETDEGWARRSAMVEYMRRNARADGQSDWTAMLGQAQTLDDEGNQVAQSASPRRKIQIRASSTESRLVASPMPPYLGAGDVGSEGVTSSDDSSGSSDSRSYTGSSSDYSSRSSYSSTGSDVTSRSGSSSYSSRSRSSSSETEDDQGRSGTRRRRSRRNVGKGRNGRKRKGKSSGTGHAVAFEGSGSESEESYTDSEESSKGSIYHGGPLRRENTDKDVPKFDDRFSDSGGSVRSDRWQGDGSGEEKDEDGQARSKGSRKGANSSKGGDSGGRDGGSDRSETGADNSRQGDRKTRKRDAKGRTGVKGDVSEVGSGSDGGERSGSGDGGGTGGKRRGGRNKGGKSSNGPSKSRSGKGAGRKGGRGGPLASGYSDDSGSEHSNSAGEIGHRKGRSKSSKSRGGRPGINRQGSTALLDLIGAADDTTNDGDVAAHSESKDGGDSGAEFGLHHGGEDDEDGAFGGGKNGTRRRDVASRGKEGTSESGLDGSGSGGGYGDESGGWGGGTTAGSGLGQAGGEHGWPIDEEVLAKWCGLGSVSDLRSIAGEAVDKKRPYSGMSAQDLELEAKDLWESIMVQYKEAQDIKSYKRKKDIDAKRKALVEAAGYHKAEIDSMSLAYSQGAVVEIVGAGVPGRRTVAVQTDV